MPSKESTEPKPVVTKDSSEFKLELYASLPQEELVVFAVQVLQADGSPARMEDIVSTCFRFFPHSFALKNYFYWPDSALVARRLSDAKDKGLLKGNAGDGFEVKVQGRKVAKGAAKALGVSFPIPPKAEEPAPAPVEEKKEEEKEEEKKETVPSAPAAKVVKKRVTGNKKKQTEQKKVKAEKRPAVKRRTAKPKVQAKPKKAVVTPGKKKPATQPKAAPKRTVRPTAKARVKKKEERKKTAQKPAVKPPIKKVEKAVEKKQEARRKETRAYAQPKQLTPPPAPPPAKKKAQVADAKPRVKDEPKPVKGQAAPVIVSKEERDKAAKIVKQVERSDAFRHYKRNGRKAHISEFEFRDMLFTTMESSPETLKRNVDTFRRYAGIRERADLIAFLDFCEEHFAALLKPKAKKAFGR